MSRASVGLRPLDEAARPGLAHRTAVAAVRAPIILYQRLISPAMPRRCKYEPTCSRYAVQALGRYGILRGLTLAAWRLLRCNPWSHGGYDPVEAQRLFKTPSAVPRPNRRSAA
jgi:putative membrane protein insertion efficiency factor